MPDEPTTGATVDNSDAGNTGGQSKGDAGQAGETKTYTQADLDRIMADVRRGAKPADYDDLKTKAAELDKLQDANKSEVQKLSDQLTKKDDEIKNLPSKVRRQTLKFASAASQKGFVDVEDAFLYVGDVDFDDDKAISQALDELAKRKPHLVGRNVPQGDGGNGPRGGAQSGTDMNSLIRQGAGRT